MPPKITKKDSHQAVASEEHRLGDIVGITLPTGEAGVGVVTGYTDDGYYVYPFHGSIFVAMPKTAEDINAEQEAEATAEKQANFEKLEAEAKAAVALAEEAHLALTA